MEEKIITKMKNAPVRFSMELIFMTEFCIRTISPSLLTTKTLSHVESSLLEILALNNFQTQCRTNMVPRGNCTELIGVGVTPIHKLLAKLSGVPFV